VWRTEKNGAPVMMAAIRRAPRTQHTAAAAAAAAAVQCCLLHACDGWPCLQTDGVFSHRPAPCTANADAVLSDSYWPYEYEYGPVRRLGRTQYARWVAAGGAIWPPPDGCDSRLAFATDAAVGGCGGRGRARRT
jgi:hypothetical protein